MLEGFEQFNLSVGKASMSVGPNGVSFSKTTVIRMGKCSHVQLFINSNSRQVAIKKATENDEGSIPFYNDERKLVSVRWNNKELIRTISNLMDWKLEGKVYRVDGTYSYEDDAMIFDLNSAEEQISKKNTL